VCLEILSDCLNDVLDRWDNLRRHLERLLDERHTIMNPSDHDELLWDDETFTRSRKYFWAIHCLTEFHLSISDNILQWESYYSARIEPLRKVGLLSKSDLEKLGSIESSSIGMKSIRSYFADQLESTKALRDGVSSFIVRYCV
jgi:hypothetical protein